MHLPTSHSRCCSQLFFFPSKRILLFSTSTMFEELLCRTRPEICQEKHIFSRAHYNSSLVYQTCPSLSDSAPTRAALRMNSKFSSSSKHQTQPSAVRTSSISTLPKWTCSFVVLPYEIARTFSSFCQIFSRSFWMLSKSAPEQLSAVSPTLPLLPNSL